MIIQAHVRNPDSQPVAMLERVLDETSRTAILRAAVAELEPSAEQPRESSLQRVHIRSSGGFVAEMTSVGVSGAERRHFIEIPAESFEYRSAEIARRREKQRHRLGGASLTSVYADTENGLFVRMRGADEMIDGLMALDDVQALSNQLPDNPSVATAELLAHRLNRRAVLDVRMKDGTERIVKLYRKGSSKPQAALDITSLLERTSFGKDSPISVPLKTSPLRTWPGYVMDCAPGVALASLDGEDSLSGLELAGAALGRLHRLPLRLRQSHSLSDELALLQSWTQLVSRMFPPHAKTIRAALNEVSAALLAGGEQAVTLVHRDFHGGQVLVHGPKATLIDFDTVCNGEPAQDIGNFLGHLDLARVERTVGGGSAEEAFLEGYAGAHRAADAARIEAHRRATQLRLACIYAFSDSHRALWLRLLDLVLGGRE